MCGERGFFLSLNVFNFKKIEDINLQLNLVIFCKMYLWIIWFDLLLVIKILFYIQRGCYISVSWFLCWYFILIDLEFENVCFL